MAADTLTAPNATTYIPTHSVLFGGIIIIIINRRSGITSHTSHGHKTGTRSMQPVRSVPLGGPVGGDISL